jgi:hypothetical protein
VLEKAPLTLVCTAKEGTSSCLSITWITQIWAGCKLRFKRKEKVSEFRAERGVDQQRLSSSTFKKKS